MRTDSDTAEPAKELKTYRHKSGKITQMDVSKIRAANDRRRKAKADSLAAYAADLREKIQAIAMSAPASVRMRLEDCLADLDRLRSRLGYRA